MALGVNPSIEQHENKINEMKSNFMFFKNEKIQSKNKLFQTKPMTNAINQKYQNLDLQNLTSLSSHKKHTFKLEGLSSFKTLINKNDSKKTIREN